MLINGSLTGFFRSSKKLRQGNLLSPYLVVIVMEALSCLVNKALRAFFLSLATHGHFY